MRLVPRRLDSPATFACIVGLENKGIFHNPRRDWPVAELVIMTIVGGDIANRTV